MEIHLSIKDPTPECWQDIRTLLAKHAAAVRIDTSWNAERAGRYWRSLPARAQTILREAVDRGGEVNAAVLRGPDGTGSLKGHSAAFKQALERGVRKGWWPDGTPIPVIADGPGFGKVQGYHVHRDALEAFTAVALDAQRAAEPAPGDSQLED